MRNGPRPIDLDIVFYEDGDMDTQRLTIPHPRWRERPFVLGPLADLAHGADGPGQPDGAWPPLRRAAEEWAKRGGDGALGTPAAGMAAFLPLPACPGAGLRERGLVWGGATPPRVMAILNLTPDSFSDGGRHGGSVAAALQAAREAVRQGADVLDLGGQSTRPGATPVSESEEADRVLPVLQ